MQYKPKLPTFGLDRRAATATVVLVSSAFAWYFLAFSILDDFASALTPWDASDSVIVLVPVLSANVGAIVAAAFIGTYVIGKYKKRVNFLKKWMLAGIFVSLIPVAFTPSTVSELILISIILGGYFGLGMPPTMGYFSSTTENRNRARASGLTVLLIGLSFFILGYLSTGSTIIAGLILLSLRLGSFAAFYVLEKNEVTLKDAAQIKYSKLFASRPFLLFLIPWLVFNLINYLTAPFTKNLAVDGLNDDIITLYEQILIAIFAVATGFLADRYGRKRLAIVGFIMLGLGYAALGLFQGNFGSWYIYILADGAAWGIFYVLFLFSLWGDLSLDFNSEKAYVIGSIPFLFSVLMQIVFTPLMAEADATTLFSFASFFLFIAVFPLFYAPETLSEKIMKDQDLNSYIEKAKKIAEKEEGKKQKQQKVDEQNEDLRRDSEETAEEKKARELAEKYY